MSSSSSGAASRAPSCGTAARASWSAPRTARWSRSRWTPGHAALSAPQGRPDLRLESCTRWPEKAGCGQECLGQIEAAPQACLLRNILGDWYQGKSCTFCGRSFHAIHWHDHEPGLVAPDGKIVAWDSFRAEQVVDVLATHKPVCWDCRVAESFRREHPELVVDRPQRLGPPPSMA